MTTLDEGRPLGLVANAGLYAEALKRAATPNELDQSLDTLRRLGQVIAEAAQEADAFEVERAAIELAASGHVSREQVQELIGLLDVLASDPRLAVSALLVEDDPTSAFALSSGLRDANLKLTVVGTIADANAVLASAVPDAIILDLFLPDGDGRSLLARVRSDPRTSGVHAVVVSGTNHALARSECFALGADAFLTKPVEAVELQRVIARLRRAPHRSSNTLVDRRTLLHEFTSGQAGRSVAMLRFHPVEGPEAPSDASTIDRLARKVAGLLTDLGPMAEWSDDLYCATVRHAAPDTVKRLDTIRQALRHQPVEGGAHTFSAGVAPASGGLLEVCSIASRHLWQALADGGDRVLAPASVSRPTILVVDDDRVVGALVVARLEEAGFNVEHAPDGHRALAILDDSAPALVLLDVNLPDADGFEVLQRIRSSERARNIPVIMLTGEDAEAQVVRAFALGADDYVIKPFSPAELTARVVRSLG